MLRVVNRILPRATSLRALSTEKPKVPKKSKEEIMKEKTPAGKLDDLVNLPPAALRKLQQLSLITLAANSTSNRQLPYADVIQYLGLSSVRELEDIVIDAIYNKLIKARLDSKGQFIEVDDWASRDTPANNIPAIVNLLTEFAQSAADVRQHTLVDADRRDAQVTAERKRAQQAEADLIAARKALDESVMATMNSHDPATSTRAKASRTGRQRPGQTAPASK
ncbi:PCI domain protein [Ancylostoma caninum]|uniref:PCI domain protein n=1 Tax=Ancylostoma caninum TaxID=29170 RepID=A0A368FIJ7_ANCCA|nr:PCI domain protein [Ancylostoma caninum]